MDEEGHELSDEEAQKRFAGEWDRRVPSLLPKSTLPRIASCTPGAPNYTLRHTRLPPVRKLV